MGFIQVISGFFSYVMVLAKNGFYPRQLIGIRKEWENEENNDMLDGFGQEWVSCLISVGPSVRLGSMKSVFIV